MKPFTPQTVVCVLTATVLAWAQVDPAIPNHPAQQAIEYQLPSDGPVSLGIYETHGRLARTLFSGQVRRQGSHRQP